MIDRDGFRPNVAIVMLNARREVFWAKRVGMHAWQFPQGGIDQGEHPQQALYRELHEEVGLSPAHVRVLGRTRDWLRYETPSRTVRGDRGRAGVFRGQKQIWFLLQLVAPESRVNLRSSARPEFDAWRWCDYWSPANFVVDFKRDVYKAALTELAAFVPSPSS